MVKTYFCRGTPRKGQTSPFQKDILNLSEYSILENLNLKVETPVCEFEQVLVFPV